MAGELINDGVTPFTMGQKQTGSRWECLREQIAEGRIPYQPDFRCGNYCGVYTRDGKGGLYAASGKPVGETCFYPVVEVPNQGSDGAGATGIPQ